MKQNQSSHLDFKNYYDKEKERLFRTALVICGDKDWAEDLVQESVHRFLKAPKSFRGESHIHTYIVGIMKNVFKKQLRLKAKEKNSALHENIADTSEASSSESENKTMELEQFKSAVRSLKPALREVLLMHHFNRYSLREISLSLNVPEGTVKSRLHNARISLARLIKKSEINYGR